MHPFSSSSHFQVAFIGSSTRLLAFRHLDTHAHREPLRLTFFRVFNDNMGHDELLGSSWYVLQHLFLAHATDIFIFSFCLLFRYILPIRSSLSFFLPAPSFETTFLFAVTSTFQSFPRFVLGSWCR
jgi:hypothetical protein